MNPSVFEINFHLKFLNICLFHTFRSGLLVYFGGVQSHFRRYSWMILKGGGHTCCLVF